MRLHPREDLNPHSSVSSYSLLSTCRLIELSSVNADGHFVFQSVVQFAVIRQHLRFRRTEGISLELEWSRTTILEHEIETVKAKTLNLHM